jgi:hypothetical protein
LENTQKIINAASLRQTWIAAFRCLDRHHPVEKPLFTLWQVSGFHPEYVRAWADLALRTVQTRTLLVQFANHDAAKTHGVAVILERDMAAQQGREFRHRPEFTAGDQLPAFRTSKVEVDDLLAV